MYKLDTVLVPFRGNTFLNTLAITVAMIFIMFSSPFGVTHFLTLSPETRYLSRLPDRVAAQKQIALNFMCRVSIKC